MLEFWELCEYAQCAWYMNLRYILYFYCFPEHFTSISLYFVVYSIYTRVCTVATHPFASVTYRDNRYPILYLVLIMRTIYACWFDFNNSWPAWPYCAISINSAGPVTRDSPAEILVSARRQMAVTACFFRHIGKIFVGYTSRLCSWVNFVQIAKIVL